MHKPLAAALVRGHLRRTLVIGIIATIIVLGNVATTLTGLG